MLLFHFHTLHANALWKVPSRFPPRGTERGGGGEAGPRWNVPAQQGQPLPGGMASSALPLPAGPGPPGRGQDPLPARDGSRRRQGPARSGASWAGCSCSAPASPEEVLVRRLVPGLPVCTLRSPVGKSQELYPLPTERVGFSSMRRLSFGQNLNLTLTINK